MWYTAITKPILNRGEPMKTLKELRDERRPMVTQEQVAHSLGCTSAAYNRIENGRALPQTRLLQVLAGFFDVDPAELRDHLRDQMAKKAV